MPTMKSLSKALPLLVALCTSTSLSRAESLVRRPYIQKTTPTSSVLVWTTDTEAPSLVEYGLSPLVLDKTALLPAAVTQHEVAITGLSPGTRYYYRAGSPGNPLAGGDIHHFFETAPAAGSKTKFRAWIVGDSGTGGSPQRAVRDAMLAFTGPSRPDLFLHMGDMAYGSGTELEFTDRFFAPYASILQNTVCYPTLGNHEGVSSDSGTQKGPYYTAYVLPVAGEAGGLPSGTEAYYSFDWANVHFVVLDSHDSPRHPGGAMLTWMKADLAATDKDWIVAYWHHPPYSKGTHDSDAEAQLGDMRKYALPLLEAAGVDLVLAGHSHIYERSFLVDGAYDTPTTAAGHVKDPGDGDPIGDGPYAKEPGNTAHDGAVYVVAGHGGATLGGAADHPLMHVSELQHGSCLLDVQDNRLSLVNVRADGVASDRFTLVKGGGLVLAAPDGGEQLLRGEPFDIRWTTAGALTGVREVKIELSTDGGETWSPIADTAPNTGTFTWKVPALDTKSALVRVSNPADPKVSDESNGTFSIGPTALVTVIPYGSEWKYDDKDQDHGIAWRDLDFDDTAWPSGPAPLGHGDGDEATKLFDAEPNQPSFYFRKRFSLDAEVERADLQVVHDDGVAIWINDTPVFFEHVENGVDHAAFAGAPSEENETSRLSLPLMPSPFVIGDNILAVMIKQSTEASTDLSFDLALQIASVPTPGTGGGGAGGSGIPTTGSGGTAGHTAGPEDPLSPGDCGCRAAPSGSPAAPSALVAAALLGLIRRRRTATRSRERA